MSVPEIVHRLVDRFHSQLDAYKSGGFDEAQLRVDFINPLLGKALGWDIYNERGRPEAYRDVVYEDRVKVGGGTKAPDYGFYIGGQRKFFLEAKKPSVDISGDVAPAVQLRRYAWSAKLPLSILTDFEELAVYDCRFEPEKDDPASKARLDYFSYEKYIDPECWTKIAKKFSRNAVLNGSLDKYAEEAKRKRGTQTVDDAFLREIESWREALARNLALRNGLNQRQLNYAVQMTIDRIIFLRMAEDRGVEDYERLLALQDESDVYGRLCGLFRDADVRYNSGLFHFRKERDRAEEPDNLTLELTVDDNILKNIIRGLYYPESPYEFSVLPLDVLGQVYEQFLGKVIRLTEDGHRAVVEEKPEVRKAGGVYYTPTYIVDYIVKNTVGKLLEGKRPGPRGGVSRLRIVDPACGSGSFLIRAYQYLLDWHRDSYVKDGPDKWRGQLYQGAEGKWHLTIDEKKRILLNNIYGVDIDPQAVEVAKLSLLLKVLEDESKSTLATQLRMFRVRALPDLNNNIKCGNSLIGPDFYENEQMLFLNDGDVERINVFNWEKSFPHVFTDNNPGFDAVIGNPPYGIIFDDLRKPYLEKHYSGFVRNNDNYAAFTQRAVELLARRGLFGFIIPNTFLIGPYFDLLKRKILDAAYTTQIVDFGLHQVFPKPNVFTAIVLLEKKSQMGTGATNTAEFVRVHDLLSFPRGVSGQELNETVLYSLRWTPETFLLTRPFERTPPLDELAHVKDVGLNYWTKGRGKTRGGSIATRVLYGGKPQNSRDKRYLKGRDISRYSVTPGDQWLRHDYQDHLNPTIDTFRYSAEFLEREKIVYRQTSDRIVAALEPNGLLTDKTLHTIVVRDEWQGRVDPHYLLGLLNSRLMTCLYQAMAQEEGRTFAQVKIFRVKQLPIRIIDSSDPEDVARHTRMQALVKQMLTLQKRLVGAKIERERTITQHQIDATDRQIDQLVYELYGLTDEEIAVVEEATPRQ